jgi:hypothetical protein
MRNTVAYLFSLVLISALFVFCVQLLNEQKVMKARLNKYTMLLDVFMDTLGVDESAYYEKIRELQKEFKKGEAGNDYNY